MNKLIEEDWERAHHHDEMYMKEMEFQEMEMLATKPSAKIKLIVKKEKKNEIRLNNRSLPRIN